MTNVNDIEALRAAARAGAPDDLVRYAAALVGAMRMEEAFEAYARAAAGGHAAATLEVGRMHLYGVGTHVDVSRAVEAFGRAEAAGQPVAGYFLALIALGGTALPRDGKMGERLLAAVQAGHPPALRAAAIHFGRKPNLDDQALAVRLLDHAAGRGDAMAAQLLAERLRRGEGVTARPEAAQQLRSRLREGGFPDLPEIIAVPAAPRRPAPPMTLTLDEVLEPPPPDLLSSSPRIAQVDGLLSVDECRLLVASAQPMLRPVDTLAPGVAGDGPWRTHAATFHPLLEDFALRLVQLRVAAAAGMELVHAEPLGVQRQDPVREHRPGRDDRPPEAHRRERRDAGSRRLILHAFLNTPTDAGAAGFSVAGVRVEPAAGRALLVDDRDEGGPPVAGLLDAGLPAGCGEAWLATLSFREHPCRAY